MPDPVGFLHPNKLYAMLRACPTPETRARAALEFLRATAGVERGFLFLARAGQLELAAAGREAALPEGITPELSRAWGLRLSLPPDDTRTLDVGEIRAAQLATENPIWTSPSKEAFEFRLLSTYREGRYLPIGMVVLKIKDEQSAMPVRHIHVEALCQALLDSGDIS